jgi:hypothetical protein
MSYGGGGGVLKVWKKCQVLFEWPLRYNKLKKLSAFKVQEK